MGNRTSLQICSCLFVLVFALNLEAQENYISQVFRSHLNEAPRMAWLVPPNFVLAPKKFPRIYVYSTFQDLQQAEFLGVVGKKELLEIRKKHMVACDILDQTNYSLYYKYQLSSGSVEEATRAFYTSKTLSLLPRGPFKKTTLSQPVFKEVLALISGEKVGFLHKHLVVTNQRSRYFYSFHRLYDPDTRQLFKEGLFLHGPDRELVAQEIRDVTETCADCAWLSYDDHLEIGFYFMNIFAFPEFPYPVLLLNTSTAEGRAISLVTFDGEKLRREYRDYEYVVNCILYGN